MPRDGFGCLLGRWTPGGMVVVKLRTLFMDMLKEGEGACVLPWRTEAGNSTPRDAALPPKGESIPPYLVSFSAGQHFLGDYRGRKAVG